MAQNWSNLLVKEGLSDTLLEALAKVLPKDSLKKLGSLKVREKKDLKVLADAIKKIKTRVPADLFEEIRRRDAGD